MTSTVVTPNISSISLYYTESNSDKEYHLQVVGNEEEGYRVNFQYGRRGQKLQTGTKTKSSVDLATALTIMGQLVQEKEKKSKGYTEGFLGTPYVSTENAGRVSGVLPQLLNFIDEGELQTYLNDDAWVMQEKKDGVRQLIKKSKKTVEGVNKKGLIVSLPQNVVDEVRLLCGEADATIDGELVGEVYWMFDLLSIGVHALSGDTYTSRLSSIQEWFGDQINDVSFQHIKMVPTAIGKASKKALYAKLKKENAEGIVFKKLDSLYKPGRPNSGGSQVKFKFLGSATVRCKNLNDKSSFVMEMLNKGDWVEIGNCTFFPTKLTPSIGKLYEVHYLYAYIGGSLFQPVLKEERIDADEGDCLTSQLKYKKDSVEDDG